MCARSLIAPFRPTSSSLPLQHGCFDSMSNTILHRIDDMGARLDELERGESLERACLLPMAHAPFPRSYRRLAPRRRPCLWPNTRLMTADRNGCATARGYARSTLALTKPPRFSDETETTVLVETNAASRREVARLPFILTPPSCICSACGCLRRCARGRRRVACFRSAPATL